MPYRPQVFISSTIDDFRDLRFALKYWFEEAGFTVFLSDSAGFPVDPAMSTFDNCLNAIRHSEYYLLLLGFQRGSFCDEARHITFTRAEYRAAYERAKNSLCKAHYCIRAEVADALISGHREGFRDFDFTEEFFNEIRRNDEVADAVKTGGPFPIGNWVSEFRDFRDVAQILASSFGIERGLRRRAIEANLNMEIENNLRLLLRKRDGYILSRLRENLKLQREVGLIADDIGREKQLSEEQTRRLAGLYFDLQGIDPGLLSSEALDDALESGEFLDYSIKTGCYEAGPLQERLGELRAILAKMRRIHDSELAKEGVQDLLQRFTSRQCGFRGGDLMVLFGLANEFQNALSLMVCIHGYLGGTVNHLNLWNPAPVTPILGEAGLIEAEKLSREEACHWVQSVLKEDACARKLP